MSAKVEKAAIGSIVIVVVALCWCPPALADNGDLERFWVYQWHDEQETRLPKYYKAYEDTTDTNFLPGKPWCMTTDTSGTKLMHWHIASSDLVDEQIEYANAYAEYHYAALTAGNRLDDASIYAWCHSWALGLSHPIKGPDNETLLDDDYFEISLSVADTHDFCVHADNHTSKVGSKNPCTGAISTVVSKWGPYGVYITGPGIYGGITAYYLNIFED